MKLSLLDKLFKNEISIDEFKKSIQNEVELYSNKLKIKGTSVPINIDEDCSLYFVKNDLMLLCKYYLDDRLTDLDIYFIADCLTLSNSVSFESEKLLELLEEMIYSDTNISITKKTVLLIIDTLNKSNGQSTYDKGKWK